MKKKLTLEDQLTALMKEHNLNCISVGMLLTGGKYIPQASAHGPDSNGISICTLGDHSEHTLFAQLGKTIGTLNQKRAVGNVEIDDLETMR